MIWILLLILIVGLFLCRSKPMTENERIECESAVRFNRIAYDNYRNGLMPKEEFDSIHKHFENVLEGIEEKYD